MEEAHWFSRSTDPTPILLAKLCGTAGFAAQLFLQRSWFCNRAGVAGQGLLELSKLPSFDSITPGTATLCFASVAFVLLRLCRRAPRHRHVLAL